MKKSKNSKHGTKRAGPGRKPIARGRAQTLSGSVTQQQYTAFERRRAADGLTRSEALRAAVAAWLAGPSPRTTDH